MCDIGFVVCANFVFEWSLVYSVTLRLCVFAKLAHASFHDPAVYAIVVYRVACD